MILLKKDYLINKFNYKNLLTTLTYAIVTHNQLKQNINSLNKYRLTKRTKEKTEQSSLRKNKSRKALQLR